MPGPDPTPTGTYGKTLIKALIAAGLVAIGAIIAAVVCYAIL